MNFVQNKNCSHGDLLMHLQYSPLSLVGQIESTNTDKAERKKHFRSTSLMGHLIQSCSGVPVWHQLAKTHAVINSTLHSCKNVPAVCFYNVGFLPAKNGFAELMRAPSEKSCDHPRQ